MQEKNIFWYSGKGREEISLRILLLRTVYTYFFNQNVTILASFMSMLRGEKLNKMPPQDLRFGGID